MKIILHSISSYMEKPVILALLILALITALLLITYVPFFSLALLG